MEQELLTISQVRAKSGLGLQRIYLLIRENRFPGVVRFGRQIRIDAKKLGEYINAGGEGLPGGWRKQAER